MRAIGIVEINKIFLRVRVIVLWPSVIVTSISLLLVA